MSDPRHQMRQILPAFLQDLYLFFLRENNFPFFLDILFLSTLFLVLLPVSDVSIED